MPGDGDVVEAIYRDIRDGRDVARSPFPGFEKPEFRTAPERREPVHDYGRVDMDGPTREKIAALKKAVAGIESRVVDEADFSREEKKYRVDYAASLNPRQLAAVTATEGPVLVIAGAGSGKTRTITYRVGYLLENGVPPQSILLLTFTRKAASEMITRTAKLLGDQSALRITGGTFHSFSNLVLRRYSNLLGLRPNFTIIDTADSEDVVDFIRHQLKMAKRETAFPRKERVYEIISKARNSRMTIGEVIMKYYSGLADYVKDLELIAGVYGRYKLAKSVLDYDDLMDFLCLALRENERFRDALSSAYEYVMVDEYQDTNLVQKEIVDLIAAKRRNVMVVGDDSQSIYSFRGANYENILRFPETYPDCRVVKLEENYRSGRGILDFINCVSSMAGVGYRKNLFTRRDASLKPKFARFFGQQEEAEYIVGRIVELREMNVPLSQIAVVYRASYHGNYIQAELMKRGIPYVVVGGIKFVERRQVKDVLAYLRIALNPYDSICWTRILKLLPGVGPATCDRIIGAVEEQNGLPNFDAFAGKAFYVYLQDLASLIRDIAPDEVTVAAKIERIKRYYAPVLKSIEDDWEVRMQDIDVLANLAKKYGDLEKFLTDFALDPPSNRFQQKNVPMIDESEEDPVTLTTVHSAKGLEWYAVFVCHLLDGLFPSVKALDSFEELEEERRLFYVACSRAKEELHLTMPSYFTSWSGFFTMPSRFLAEADAKTYETQR